MRSGHFERVDYNTVVLFRNSHVIALRTFEISSCKNIQGIF